MSSPALLDGIGVCLRRGGKVVGTTLVVTPDVGDVGLPYEEPHLPQSRYMDALGAQERTSPASKVSSAACMILLNANRATRRSPW